MFQIKSGTSNASDCHNLDNHDSCKDVDQDDLKEIILTTVAEELASMVACSGDQLENIAKNHNAGMDESEMAYVYNLLYWFVWVSNNLIYNEYCYKR